jgi:hypothetical protein
LNLYVHYFKESSNMSFLMKWINTKQEAWYFCGLCHTVVSVWAV